MFTGFHRFKPSYNIHCYGSMSGIYRTKQADKFGLTDLERFMGSPEVILGCLLGFLEEKQRVVHACRAETYEVRKRELL